FHQSNLTAVTEFFLVGFQGSKFLRIFLFCLFLIIYCGTICGNLLIIVLVSTSRNLHTPMYFFISQLSISDILLTTDIVPNLLNILLSNGGTIGFISCMTQLYFFCVAESSECFLLTVMSYDRYVAICNPLRYSSIMTSAFCMKFITICWLVVLTISLTDSVTIPMFTFCGPNAIHHFYCDLVPLIELACSDTLILQIEVFILVVPLVITPPIIIILSYMKIIVSILRIPSTTGRQKAFSTCSSHLTVVSIFYWTIFSVYMFPTKGETLIISKILSLIYTVFTPFINPIIYSLRNQDIKKAAQEKFHKRVTL
ncbi:hypothetical protein GDO81_008907, partial [Engystomops pustulosus]